MIKKNYLEELKTEIIAALKGENARVFLFGSRARGDHHVGSDVDIGVLPVGEFDRRKITLLRERLENFNTPYKVEIVDLSHVSDVFLKQVMQEAVVWKD
ncbi:MAG: nucleotidyltransferase domain-containing protein [Candidatus Omnitrophica bacterium]|nr:nucleotidyltransferase domain-containing protein [Candidatus Omnitrophota bacterium]